MRASTSRRPVPRRTVPRRTAPRRTALRARVTARAAVAVGLLVAGLAATSATHAVADVAVPAPSAGSWTVSGHGFGHGHGLSQYGAEGAATRGLSGAQIIAFYYPHTTLAQKASTGVRVLVGDSGTATVLAQPGLAVTGVGGLSTSGISRYRLVASGSGLALQALRSTGWTQARAGLPAAADFTRTGGLVRLVHDDGSSTDYRGSVGAVRSGSGTLTINRVGLDDYTQGVVPRESPASWPAAALQAQAIAARSYVRYEVEHHVGAPYDICDTTDCQVYGGAERYAPDGSASYGEDPRSNAAVAATRGEVATYGGATIFAQFSADDGGYTADGGQPYLTAHPDPYEQYSGSPYLNWTRTVAPSTVAAAYGLATVTAVQVTARDGHGAWGGRVLSALIYGTRPGGARATVATSGSALADAMDLPHPWFQVGSAGQAPAKNPAVCPGPGVGLTNPSFESGLTGWTASATNLAGYGSSRPGAGGKLLNGYATAARGSIRQDVAPTGGIVPGRTYGATIWLSQRVGLAPTDVALAVFGLGGKSASAAVSYARVPADGKWHAYSTQLTPTVAGTTLRMQLYFWYAHQSVSIDGARLSDECLSNPGFATSGPYNGWRTGGLSTRSYGSNGASDRLLNGQATVARGFLAQSVTPYGGTRPGQSYTGSVRVLVAPTHGPADIALSVANTTSTGAQVGSDVAVSYLRVPNDGRWHDYSTTLPVTHAGNQVRWQLTLWYPNQNISIDAGHLT